MSRLIVMKKETTMKRLVCTLAALVVTLVAVPPVGATYLGTWPQSQPYLIDVVADLSTDTPKVSITILVIINRGKLEVEDVLVLDTSIPNTQERTIARNAVRMIFKADVPGNQSAIFRFFGRGERVPVYDHNE